MLLLCPWFAVVSLWENFELIMRREFGLGSVRGILIGAFEFGQQEEAPVNTSPRHGHLSWNAVSTVYLVLIFIIIWTSTT